MRSLKAGSFSGKQKYEKEKVIGNTQESNLFW